MIDCTHKTFVDFTLPREPAPARREAPVVRNPETGRIVIKVETDAEPAPAALKWRCSGCGVVDVWDAGWAYYGAVECRRCWTADIESVHCPACAAKRKEKRPTVEGLSKSERSQTRREARVAAKLALAEAKVARLRDELKGARK